MPEGSKLVPFNACLFGTTQCDNSYARNISDGAVQRSDREAKIVIIIIKFFTEVQCIVLCKQGTTTIQLK